MNVAMVWMLLKLTSSAEDRKEAVPNSNVLYSPNLDRFILAATDQGVSILTERYAPNRCCVASKSVEELAGDEVPHLDRLISAPTNQDLLVATERHTPNKACMVLKSVQELTSG